MISIGEFDWLKFDISGKPGIMKKKHPYIFIKEKNDDRLFLCCTHSPFSIITKTSYTTDDFYMINKEVTNTDLPKSSGICLKEQFIIKNDIVFFKVPFQNVNSMIGDIIAKHQSKKNKKDILIDSSDAVILNPLSIRAKLR